MRLIAVLALLAIIGATVFLLRSGLDRGPRMDLKPFHALGTIAAQEAVQAASNSAQILLIVEDFGQYNMPWRQTQIDAFQRAIHRARGAQILGIEPVRDSMLNGPPELAFTAGRFSRLLQQYPNPSVIVIFAACPPLYAKDIDTLERAGVKLLIVSMLHSSYETLFARGLLHMVIVPKPSPDVFATSPKTPRDWFDQSYDIVTSSNFASASF